MAMMKSSKLLAHCYWMVILMRTLPEWVVEFIAPPALKDLLAYKKVCNIV